MLYLHCMGHFHPENIITNKFLEDLDIGTSESWILERVGIENRRTILPLDYIKQTKNVNRLDAPKVAQYNHSQMGAAAARMALKRSSSKLEEQSSTELAMTKAVQETHLFRTFPISIH